MKCNLDGCPGEYEEREIAHTARHQGRVIVIDRVPTDVCSVCGDVLLRPDVVRRIEALLRTEVPSTMMFPLYEYARSA